MQPGRFLRRFVMFLICRKCARVGSYCAVYRTEIKKKEILIQCSLNICDISCLNRDEMKLYFIKDLLQLYNILLLNPSFCAKQKLSTIEQSEISQSVVMTEYCQGGGNGGQCGTGWKEIL